MTAQEKRFAQKRALKAIKTEINPELNNLLKFMTTEYFEFLRPGPGLISLPDGAARYKAILQFYNDFELDPEEIHQTGLNGIQVLKNKSANIMQELGLKNMTFREFSDHAQNYDISFNDSQGMMNFILDQIDICLLYTSDAADE